MVSIKNIIFGIAIFFLTMFVGIYGISTLYEKSPDYEDYCPNINNETMCVAEGGTWVNYSVEVGDGRKPTSEGYCNIWDTCNEKWNLAQEKHSRNVFFIALPLGVLVIALGALVFGLEFVGAGLMAGGVGIILYGIGNYWRYSDDWLKFLISLVGLVAIIALSYYFNSKWQK